MQIFFFIFLLLSASVSRQINLTNRTFSVTKHITGNPNIAEMEKNNFTPPVPQETSAQNDIEYLKFVWYSCFMISDWLLTTVAVDYRKYR